MNHWSRNFNSSCLNKQSVLWQNYCKICKHIHPFILFLAGDDIKRCHKLFVTLGTRGFSHVRREFTVLAEGRSHERSREKNLWHGAVLYTVPVDLWAFYQITFMPIRLKASNCYHVDRHVKKCPKTHIILRKTSSSLKFIAWRTIMTGSHRNSSQLM